MNKVIVAAAMFSIGLYIGYRLQQLFDWDCNKIHDVDDDE